MKGIGCAALDFACALPPLLYLHSLGKQFKHNLKSNIMRVLVVFLI
jgi:hypothetical protein